MLVKRHLRHAHIVPDSFSAGEHPPLSGQAREPPL
jgi:hypothetical protein